MLELNRLYLMDCMEGMAQLRLPLPTVASEQTRINTNDPAQRGGQEDYE